MYKLCIFVHVKQLKLKTMKTLLVNGYKMVKNPETWDMEKVGDILTIEVTVQKNSIEFIEGIIANQEGFDWFQFESSENK